MISLTGDVATGGKILGQAARRHQAHAPRARRQGAGDRVRRRRHRGGRRRACAPSATTTPARTAPPPAASTPAPRSTTGWSPTCRRRSARIKIGLQTADGVEMGPLISAEQRERVAGFVARAQKQKHIEVTTGGKRRRRRRLLLRADRRRRRPAERRDRAPRGVRPGGLGHALQGHRRRPSPGPTTPTTASRPRCGRRTSARRMQVASRLQYGCTWINTHFMLVSEMPHGGLKRSGYGKDLSMYALEDYTVVRHVMAKLYGQRLAQPAGDRVAGAGGQRRHVADRVRLRHPEQVERVEGRRVAPRPGGRRRRGTAAGRPSRRATARVKLNTYAARRFFSGDEVVVLGQEIAGPVAGGLRVGERDLRRPHDDARERRGTRPSSGTRRHASGRSRGCCPAACRSATGKFS